MIPLDSPQWSELSHAYGPAADVPALLEAAAGLPPSGGWRAEPYFSLWSALCHQGDVYTASYAAVPHLLEAMEGAPLRVPMTLLLLVASIEIARATGRGPAVPEALRADYDDALARVPAVVGAASRRDWDEDFCRVALAAVAAAKGFAMYAQLLVELESDTVAAVVQRLVDGGDVEDDPDLFGPR